MMKTFIYKTPGPARRYEIQHNLGTIPIYEMYSEDETLLLPTSLTLDGDENKLILDFGVEVDNVDTIVLNAPA